MEEVDAVPSQVATKVLETNFSVLPMVAANAACTRDVQNLLLVDQSSVLHMEGVGVV
jgi:hypothetical protein